MTGVPTHHDAILLELAEAGKRMRDLQRQFFKTKDRGVLVASKEAEKRFDELLAAILDKPAQGSLV